MGPCHAPGPQLRSRRPPLSAASWGPRGSTAHWATWCASRRRAAGRRGSRVLTGPDPSPRLRETRPLPSRQQRPVRRVARSARPEGRRGGFGRQPRSQRGTKRRSFQTAPAGCGRLVRRPVRRRGELKVGSQVARAKAGLAGGSRKRGRRTRSHPTPEQTETVARNCRTRTKGYCRLSFCSGSRISRRKAYVRPLKGADPPSLAPSE